MSRLNMRVICLIAVLVVARNAGAAGPVKFAHSGSAYADRQGVALNHPEGVACGPGPTVIVADTENGRLLRYVLAADVLTEGSPIKVPQVQYPVRVHTGSNGDILVLDGKLRRIIRLNAAGAFLNMIEPKGVPKGNVVPKSFALDRENRIYILDNFSRRVVVTDPSGGYQREIPFPEKFGFFSDVAVDTMRTVYLLDTVAGSLYTAGKDAGAFSLLTKDLREYANFPAYVTTDGKGIVYVVDQNGGGVIVLGQDGSFQGRQLTLGWKEGLLMYPCQMCISEQGIAVISDRENNRVQSYKVSR